MLTLKMTDGQEVEIGEHVIRAERWPGCWHLVYNGIHGHSHEIKGGIYIMTKRMRGSDVRVVIKAPRDVKIRLLDK